MLEPIAAPGRWLFTLRSLSRAGIPSTEVQAIREQRLPDDPKLAALSALARGMIEQRGQLAEAELNRFVQAGYRQDQILEAITVIAASAITNYTANVANLPLEDALREHAWSDGAPPSH